MTIEIHGPELEVLIKQRMKSGGFLNIEDVLLQALKTAELVEDLTGRTPDRRTGADLIAAMQASPYREIEIEPARYRLPIPDIR